MAKEGSRSGEDTDETKVTVRVPLGTRLALRSVLEQHQAFVRKLRSSHQARLKELTPAQRDVLRAGQHQELLALRRHGGLLDNGNALVTFGLRREVEARGWDRPWPDVDGEGVPMDLLPISGGGGYPERLSLLLPATLVEQVHAGCWPVSKESIGQLGQWRGNHAAGVLRPQATAPEEQAAAAEYRCLAAGVTETGEVYRAGIRRGLHAALQAMPSPQITVLGPEPR
ncbi:hypothetical protein AB0D33_13205 [Streptomyces sp. NPDC048404]|uniref:hypothetical protein n=1 Tax=unclassified Streptomyces TaxID=2593676 RepID=UPI00343C7557